LGTNQPATFYGRQSGKNPGIAAVALVAYRSQLIQVFPTEELKGTTGAVVRKLFTHTTFQKFLALLNYLLGETILSGGLLEPISRQDESRQPGVVKSDRMRRRGWSVRWFFHNTERLGSKVMQAGGSLSS
jgi:hypothetical protein